MKLLALRSLTITLFAFLLLIANANAQQPANDSSSIKQTATVNTETLNVRAEPDINSNIVGQLDNGDKVEVIENLDYWVKVSLADEKQGWVYKTLVNITNITQPEMVEKTVPEPTPNSGPRNGITSYATIKNELTVCMSQNEAKRILGEPGDIEKVITQANTKEIWKYFIEDEGILHITFLNGSLIFHQLSMIN